MKNQKEATDKYIQEGYLYFSFDFLKNWNKELEESLEQEDSEKREYIENSEQWEVL